MSSRQVPSFISLPREATAIAAFSKSHTHSSELEVLASSASSDVHMIIAGTCSTKSPNSIHIVEFNEDTNTIRETHQFPHPSAVEQIVTSPFHDDRYIVLSTDSYATISNASTTGLSFNKATMYGIIPDPRAPTPTAAAGTASPGRKQPNGSSSLHTAESTPMISVPVASFNVPSELITYVPPKLAALEKKQSTFRASTGSSMTGSEHGYDAMLFDTLFSTQIASADAPVSRDTREGVPGVSASSPLCVLWENDFSSSIPSNVVCLIFAFGVALYDISRPTMALDHLQAMRSTEGDSRSSSKAGARDRYDARRASLAKSPDTFGINASGSVDCVNLNPLYTILFDHAQPVTPSAVCWDAFSSDPYSHIYAAHGSDVILWDVSPETFGQDDTNDRVSTSTLSIAKQVQLYSDGKGVPENPFSSKSPASSSNSSTPVSASSASSVSVSSPASSVRKGVPRVVVSNAHARISSLDANPNKPHHIVTTGSDGEVKLWDARRRMSAMLPISVLRGHTYPTLKAIFNISHDQLLLSTGLDNKINLWGIPTLSSVPTADDGPSASSISAKKNGRGENTEANQLLQCYEIHQDAVYNICWTRKGSWHFFSLSFDGRLVALSVPPTVKYRILL